MRAIIGTAGWSIPREHAVAFPADGSALGRYARVFPGVEINSSFHRSHRPSTWERWAASVPDAFRFSVKVPKTITHQAKLVDVDALVDAFQEEIVPLGDKLSVLLVQLPPKLVFDAAIADRFFSRLKVSTHAAVACEPRNATWFEDEADALLRRLQVARVAADPSPVPRAAQPGGWLDLAYWRLHGSPVVYRSEYGAASLEGYAQPITSALARGCDVWCTFDNTASSAATGNALSMVDRVKSLATLSC